MNKKQKPIKFENFHEVSKTNFDIEDFESISYSLKSLANKRFVCADKYGSAPLVANREHIDLWEKFYIEYNLEDCTHSLKALVNSKYVCAENAANSCLIANRDAVGRWEKFYIIENSDGTFSFKSLENGKYVCAEGFGFLPLIANRKSSSQFNFNGFGSWEKFYFVANSTHSRVSVAIKSYLNEKFITIDNNSFLAAVKEKADLWERFYIEKNPDSTYSLRVYATSRIICAEHCGHSNLVANRNAIQAWEKFFIIENSDNTYSFKSVTNRNYVSVENTKLIANKCGIGHSEKFYLIPIKPSRLVSIKSFAINRFISVNNNSSLFVSNKGKVESTEKFYIESHPDDSFSVKAFVNSKYVHKNNNNSILEANGDSVDSTERFKIIQNFDGTISIQEFLKGDYLSVNMSSLILARKTSISEFEKFYLEDVSRNVESFKDFMNEKFTCKGLPLCFCIKCLP